MKQFLLVSAAAISLAACGTTNPNQITPDSVSGQIVSAPDWYFSYPFELGKVYSSGTAVSPDLQFSVDLAVLNAKNTLADRLEGQMSSLTKSHTSKVGNSTEETALIEDYQKTTTNLIDKVDVSGYTVVKNEVTVDGAQYRAFVLLSFDSHRFDKFSRAARSYNELDELTAVHEPVKVESVVEDEEETPTTVINVDTVVNTTESKDEEVNTVVENTTDEETN